MRIESTVAHPRTVRTLSTAQQAFWQKQTNDSEAGGIIVGLSIDIFADIQPDLFRTAAQALLDQCDALRTSFKQVNGVVSQVVRANVPVSFQHRDLSWLGKTDECRARLVEEWARRPFDLRVPPLIDHLLVRVGPDHWTWHCRAHHLIIDAGGAAIGVAAILEAYATLVAGGSPDMSRLGSYSEHLDADEAYVASERYREDLVYWLARHAAPALLLFGDGEGTHEPVTPRQRTVDRVQYMALVESCRADGIQPFHAFIGALGALAYRLLGRTSLSLGLATHNRSSELDRRTVGLFAGTMAFRLEIDPNESLAELARRAATHLRRDYRHARLPLHHLAAAIGGADEPLFDLSLSFQPLSYSMDMNGAAVRLRTGIFAGMDTERAAIHIRDPQGDSPLGVDLTHRADLVRSADVVRLYEAFVDLIAEWPRHSTQSIARLFRIQGT